MLKMYDAQTEENLRQLANALSKNTEFDTVILGSGAALSVIRWRMDAGII